MQEACLESCQSGQDPEQEISAATSPSMPPDGGEYGTAVKAMGASRVVVKKGASHK